jgi:hypothetical protein
MFPQSARVYQDAYGCEWQDLCRGEKRLICMIIMRGQRPVAVHAGLFGDICLPTFSTVSRTSAGSGMDMNDHAILFHKNVCLSL